MHKRNSMVEIKSGTLRFSNDFCLHQNGFAEATIVNLLTMIIFFFNCKARQQVLLEINLRMHYDTVQQRFSEHFTRSFIRARLTIKPLVRCHHQNQKRIVFFLVCENCRTVS